MLLFLGLLGLVNLLGVELLVLVGPAFFGAFAAYCRCWQCGVHVGGRQRTTITCSPITCGRARFF